MTDGDDTGSSDVTMRWGYVAMLDVLGWKGIWKRHEMGAIRSSARTVVDEGSKIEQVTEEIFAAPSNTAVGAVLASVRSGLAGAPRELLDEFEERVARLSVDAFTEPLHRIQARFLSDTLVLAIHTPDEWGRGVQHALLPAQGFWMAVQVARVIQACAAASAPLLFRGAITRGEFFIEENMLLGQAIDDASKEMNVANAAVAWFHGLDEMTTDATGTPYVVRYKMPLRNEDGGTRDVLAVNPFLGLRAEQASALRARMVEAFGNESANDVVVKKRNTSAFLDAAYDEWLSHLRSPAVEALMATANERSQEAELDALTVRIKAMVEEHVSQIPRAW